MDGRDDMVFTLIRPQLTKLDFDEGYTNDNLADALAQDVACYHICRIALLYFSNTPINRLTREDIYENIPKLLTKIFGQNADMHLVNETEVNTEYGWLERQSGARDSPIDFFLMLRNYNGMTFDKEKVSRQSLGAFRLCEILDPFIEGSLLDLFFRQTSSLIAMGKITPFNLQVSSGLGVHYVKLDVFSESAKAIFHNILMMNKFDNQKFELLPDFLKVVLTSRTQFVKVTERKIEHENSERSVMEVYLPFELPEYFLISFIHWLVNFPKNNFNIMQQVISYDYNVPLSTNGGFNPSLDNANIHVLMKRNIALQVFSRLLKYFFPHSIESKSGIHGVNQVYQKMILDILIELLFKKKTFDLTSSLSLHGAMMLHVLFVHIVSAPDIKMVGTDETLKYLFPHIRNFARISLRNSVRQNQSSGNENVAATMNQILGSLMTLLSPFNAHYFNDQTPCKSLTRNRSVAPNTAPSLYQELDDSYTKYLRPMLKQLGIELPSADFNTQAEIKVKEPCSYVLFVGIHYELYNEVLLQSLQRFNESSILESELKLIIQLFGSDENCIFNDNVLIIMKTIQLISDLKMTETDVSMVDVSTLLQENASYLLTPQNQPTLKMINNQLRTLIDFKIHVVPLYAFKDKVAKLLEQLYIEYNQRFGKTYLLAALPAKFDALLGDSAKTLNVLTEQNLKNCIERLHRVFGISVSSSVNFLFKKASLSNTLIDSMQSTFGIHIAPVLDNNRGVRKTIEEVINEEMIEKARNSKVISSFEVNPIAKLLNIINERTNEFLRTHLDLNNDFPKLNFRHFGDIRSLLRVQIIIFLLNIFWFRCGYYILEIFTTISLIVAFEFRELEVAKLGSILLANWSFLKFAIAFLYR